MSCLSSTHLTCAGLSRPLAFAIALAFSNAAIADASDSAGLQTEPASDDTNTDDPRTLDRVAVWGRREDYSTPDSSTATGLDLSLRETPQGLSVVTRALMDDFQLNSINAVLNAVPNVNVEAVETDRTYFTARGFDITNFQRDGLGLPMPYGLQNGDIDTAVYERIEVLFGANGLMSGTGNPSATVNFVRKRPTAELSGAAGVTVGSWSDLRLDADISAPLNDSGSVRGRAVAAYQQGDSYLDRYSLEKTVGYGVIEADLSEHTALAVGVSYQKNEPEGVMWGALPLYYTDGSATDFDRSTSTSADWSYWNTENTRAFIELRHDFGNDWQLVSAYNYEDIAQDSQLFYVYGTPDRETGLGLYAYPSDYSGNYRSNFFDVYVTGAFNLGGRRHELVFGGNWADADNTEISWYGNDVGTPIGPLQDWTGDYPKPAFDSYSSYADFDYRSGSAYATVRWNLRDNIKLITGANYSRVSTDGVSYGEAKDTETSKTTPFAGLTIDLNQSYSAYASYGEIFSEQGQIDINNQLVGPITGDSLEAGIKGEWQDGRLNASAALFKINQDNLAEYAGYNPNTGLSYYTGEDASSEGVELTVSGALTEIWQVFGGYTHLNITGADGLDARTYVPRDMFRLSSTVLIPQVEGLKLGAQLSWQGDIERAQGELDFNGEEIISRQQSYALLGLMASYAWNPHWTLAANIENVTNEKYLTSLYWSQGYYGAPRNGSLTLRYDF
jgi:outer-membrane receptor for ferric coprogen and ferric-rhodotorulic acid